MTESIQNEEGNSAYLERLKCGEIFYENQTIFFECRICERIFDGEQKDFIEHFEEHLVSTFSQLQSFQVSTAAVKEQKSIIEQSKNENRISATDFVDEKGVISQANSKQTPNNDQNVVDSTTNVKPEAFTNIKAATDGRFYCMKCNANYSNKYSLNIHMRHHHSKLGKALYVCRICKQILSTRATLRKHLTIHQGIKPYKCKFCPKSFRIYSLRQWHERAHTQDKRYKCSYCEKLFIQGSEKKSHERHIHTKEKLFQCETCGKKYYKGYLLRQHVRSHTGEKPFECEICQKKFSTKCTLKAHVNTHTGEKNYQCEICLANFSRRNSLRTHKQLHSGLKKYSCETCGKNFTQKAGLYCHLRSHIL